MCGAPRRVGAHSGTHSASLRATEDPKDEWIQEFAWTASGVYTLVGGVRVPTYGETPERTLDWGGK